MLSKPPHPVNLVNPVHKSSDDLYLIEHDVSGIDLIVRILYHRFNPKRLD